MSEQDFTIGFESQQEWGWLAAVALFLEGLGAGLYLVSLFLDYTLGAALGIIVVLLGALALFLDLGRPLRFWRAIVNVSSSWISRGALLIGLFTAFGLLYLAPQAGLSALPWSRDTALGQAFIALSALCAFLVAVYTGFLLSSSPSIPLWNSFFVPVQFFVYAILGGAMMLFPLRLVGEDDGVDWSMLEAGQLWLVAASLVLVVGYLAVMSSSTVAGRRSVNLLLRGALSGIFVWGVLVVGLGLPLLIGVYAAIGSAGNAAGLLALSAVLVLVGSYLFRYALLKAGLYLPLI